MGGHVGDHFHGDDPRIDEGQRVGRQPKRGQTSLAIIRSVNSSRDPTDDTDSKQTVTLVLNRARNNDGRINPARTPMTARTTSNSTRENPVRVHAPVLVRLESMADRSIRRPPWLVGKHGQFDSTIDGNSRRNRVGRCGVMHWQILPGLQTATGPTRRSCIAGSRVLRSDLPRIARPSRCAPPDRPVPDPPSISAYPRKGSHRCGGCYGRPDPAAVIDGRRGRHPARRPGMPEWAALLRTPMDRRAPRRSTALG